MGLLGYDVIYSSMKSLHDASSMSSHVRFTGGENMMGRGRGEMRRDGERRDGERRQWGRGEMVSEDVKRVSCHIPKPD